MLLEFKENNSAKAKAEKICSAYDEGLITDRVVIIWFEKFRFGDTIIKDPSHFDDNLLKVIFEQNPLQSTRDITLLTATWRN